MIKLTKRERQFCDLYARYGGNRTLICRDMGINHKSFDNYMRQDRVKEYLACSLQRARDSLIAALPSITEGLIEMYNNSDTDPKVRVAIAQQILDRGGLIIPKADMNINVSVNTAISDRARELLSQRLTIDTTASPVAPAPALQSRNIIEENCKKEAVKSDGNAVMVQDLT